MFAITGYIAGLIGLVITALSARWAIKSGVSKATIESQKTLIETLGQRVDQLEKSDKEKTATISELKTQVDTFKNIPLQQIVEVQEHILNTQREILKLLKGET